MKGTNAVAWFYGQSFNGSTRSMPGYCATHGRAFRVSEQCPECVNRDRVKAICGRIDCRDPECRREHFYTCCMCLQLVSQYDAMFSEDGYMVHPKCLEGTHAQTHI